MFKDQIIIKNIKIGYFLHTSDTHAFQCEIVSKKISQLPDRMTHPSLFTVRYELNAAQVGSSFCVVNYGMEGRDKNKQ